SPIVPQYWPPVKVQETFVQFGLPQTLPTLAPQTVPVGQVVPQSVEPPQPSPILPQEATPDCVQLVLGARFGARQMCVSGSQRARPMQPPQSSWWPQPSPTVPQYWPPVNVHVAGVQFGRPHRFGTPEPPQVSGAVQLSPQSTERPQPSPI